QVFILAEWRSGSGVDEQPRATQFTEQSGAVEACWARNPEVRGSKLRCASEIFLFLTTEY
ncbi:hypothetical protein CDAR_612971, partial [Caerostris darwini]